MSGFIDFTDGNIFSATDADTMMRQAVMRFSTTSALTSALPTGIRELGMMAWADDVETLYMWNGTNWIPINSTFKTASVLVTSGGVNVTVGNSVVASRWCYAGGFVNWNWSFTVGSTANMQTGNMAIALPTGVAIHADHAYSVIGQLSIYDTSASTMFTRNVINLNNFGNAAFVSEAGVRVASNTATPVALALGDVLMINAKWRPAVGVYL